MSVCLCVISFKCKNITLIRFTHICFWTFYERTYISDFHIGYQKSRIQETKHHSTDANSSTDTKKILLVRQNLSKIKLFLARWFTVFMSKKFQILDHFFPLVFPKDSENLKSLDVGLWEVVTKRRLNWVNKGGGDFVKSIFCRDNFRPILSKKVQIWDHFFPVLFSKDSESLKFLDIRLWEVGAKRRLNSTSKVKKWRKNWKKPFSAAAILDNFWANMFKSDTTSIHYFSPRILNL